MQNIKANWKYSLSLHLDVKVKVCLLSFSQLLNIYKPNSSLISTPRIHLSPPDSTINPDHYAGH
jgi:hypothetical protein